MLIALLAKNACLYGDFLSKYNSRIFPYTNNVFDGLMRRVMMSLKDTLDFEVF